MVNRLYVTAWVIAVNRTLRKSASDVLASLGDSTYRSVRLVSSLVEALLDSLFEHPEDIVAFARRERFSHMVGINLVFQQPVRPYLTTFPSAVGPSFQAVHQRVLESQNLPIHPALVARRNPLGLPKEMRLNRDPSKKESLTDN